MAAKKNTLKLNNAPKAKNKPADDFVDPTLQPLIDIINNGDAKAYEKYITTGSNRNLLLALTPSLRAKAKELGERIADERRISGEKNVKPIEQPLLSKTALAYVAAGFEKLTEPLNAKFRDALKRKPNQLRMFETIHHAAARSFDANKLDIKRAVVATGRSLTFDTQHYITFYKQLMSNIAFAASMDALNLRRNVPVEDLNAGLNSMLDTPPVDETDPAVFDQSNATRAAEQEPYEGGDQRDPIADDQDDVVDAVERAQAWIGLSVTNLDIDQRMFWGVDGLFPLAQRREDDEFGTTYTPITDFDDYVIWSRQQYQQKRRTVPVSPDTETSMLEH